MQLELKESNSPFWLIGTGKNKTFAGCSTNIPCYYKSRKKQEEIAKQIFKNDKNVEDVYLITGTQWDNMPSGGKEEFGYIKNKGKLILSKNEIMEADYPKGVSRDPLPKKGVKTYTSPATALEDKGEDKKMKLELKEKTEEKYIFNPGNSKEAWDSDWTKVKELAGKECVIVNSEYVSNMSKDFEDMQHTIKFDDGTTLDGVFGEYLKPVLKENIVSVDDIPQDLQDRFFTTMADGRPELFKKFTKDELKLFADFVKQLPEQEVTDLERNLLLYAISMAHGDDLTVESLKESYNKDEFIKKQAYCTSKYDIYCLKNNKDNFFVMKKGETPWENKELVQTDIEGVKHIDKFKLKESKIVTPVGNPQTAGSFVNIDVDLDHMEVSDFIVRLAQAIRSEQTAVLEYVALMSANGITNEDKLVIEGVMKEEKNHMCALTALLYKQILMNHKENVDEANDEFTLPKFGADIFDENNKLTESISTILNKIITESSHDGTNDEYTVGDRESARIYNGLSNTLNVIKNIISTSGEEVVVQNVTLSDDSKIVKESTMTIDDLINELKTDTNYDEIAYHIHEYSKVDKKKALELMDLLFDLETNKSPKECRDEIISHLTTTEDVKVSFNGETMSQEQWDVVVDVDYDADFQLQTVNNLTNAIQAMNPETFKSEHYAIAEDKYTLAGDKFNFVILTYSGFNKEINETFVEEVCDKLFEKATTYEYYIKRA